MQISLVIYHQPKASIALFTVDAANFLSSGEAPFWAGGVHTSPMIPCFALLPSVLSLIRLYNYSSPSELPAPCSLSEQAVVRAWESELLGGKLQLFSPQKSVESLQEIHHREAVTDFSLSVKTEIQVQVLFLRVRDGGGRQRERQ